MMSNLAINKNQTMPALTAKERSELRSMFLNLSTLLATSLIAGFIGAAIGVFGLDYGEPDFSLLYKLVVATFYYCMYVWTGLFFSLLANLALRLFGKISHQLVSRKKVFVFFLCHKVLMYLFIPTSNYIFQMSFTNEVYPILDSWTLFIYMTSIPFFFFAAFQMGYLVFFNRKNR